MIEDDFNIDELLKEAHRIANSPIEENNIENEIKDINSKYEEYCLSLNKDDKYIIDKINDVINIFFESMLKKENEIILTPEFIFKLSFLIPFYLKEHNIIIKNNC